MGACGRADRNRGVDGEALVDLPGSEAEAASKTRCTGLAHGSAEPYADRLDPAKPLGADRFATERADHLFGQSRRAQIGLMPDAGGHGPDIDDLAYTCPSMP